MIRLPFEDRNDAAHQLSAALSRYRAAKPLVLAIPRGGVPIAAILATTLKGELDVVLVRKLGAPGNPEFAIGAVDEQGNVVLSQDLDRLGIDTSYVRAETARQLALIRERRRRYRPEQPPAQAKGRMVIVVDDGLATGATMASALKAVRAQQPKRLIGAVPVAARESLAALTSLADEVVCLATPDPFYSVGRFYRDFSGVEEEEVVRLLNAPVHAPLG